MSNPQEFKRLMEEGAEAAWESRWQDAIVHFSQALEINGDDADANSNLALALLRTGQLERSLKFYERANQLAPDDLEPLEGMADVQEKLGKNEEAAQSYVKVSEVFLARRNLDKAIENWERAVYLQAGLVSVHARLAQAYERKKDRAKTIREYLTIAYHYHDSGNTQRAIQVVERALRLNRQHPQALNMLRALQSGGHLPDDIIKRDPPPKTTSDPLTAAAPAAPEVGEAHPLGPIGEALEESMGLLAQHVVESGLNDYVMYAMQGMEYQRQDLKEQAVDAYRQADRAGLRHPSLKMALGGLLVLTDAAEEAIPHLTQAVSQNDFTAGALHGLGQAHYKVGQHADAARYLIQSLRTVDNALATNPKEQENLAKVYDNLLTTLEGRSANDLKVINERFIGWLTGKGWKQRIAETRRHLDETLRGENQEDVFGIIMQEDADSLAQIVSGIDRYIRNGLFTLAMDEAHRAVEKAPYYLPVHVRMAEVMLREGRIRQAVNKYNMVAKSYLVREENDKAASILAEVLEKAPLDTEVRINLIHLLEEENRMDEALDQYIDLAETYQQLGNFDRANETFQLASQMAVETSAPPTKVVTIKHHIADINQMRLNTREAQRIYEEILDVKSDDEKALRGLIDIYYTQGNQVEAVKRLDTLLGIYAKSGDINKIERMLEDLIHTNPNDTALRQRLASIYRRRGRKREAIEQLDALGELQLDAGLTQDACQTIKQIVALGPENIGDYQKLLSQLGC